MLVAAAGPGMAAYANTIVDNEIRGNSMAGVTIHTHTPNQDVSDNVIADNTIGRTTSRATPTPMSTRRRGSSLLRCGEAVRDCQGQRHPREQDPDLHLVHSRCTDPRRPRPPGRRRDSGRAPRRPHTPGVGPPEFRRPMGTPAAAERMPPPARDNPHRDPTARVDDVSNVCDPRHRVEWRSDHDRDRAANRPGAAPPARPGARRRPVVGAGVSGIGAAHHLQERFPDRSLRRPRRAGRPRRHLVDPPLPGRALRQRPVHLRLPVQALARPVDRGGRGDPRTTSTRSSRRTTCSSTSATSTGCTGGQLVVRRTGAGPWRSPGPTPASSCASPPTSCGCARATTTTPSPTSRSGRAWTGSGGLVVHPQQWPEDLDLSGKRVVVIGSGSTAATLIPAHRARRRRT